MSARVIICEPAPDCGDPHLYRWHCARGHDIGRGPAEAGVCHVTKCAQTNPFGYDTTGGAA